MLCYAKTNKNLMICYKIVCYGTRFQCHGIRFKMYAIMYVVKDMLELTAFACDI